MVETKTKNKNIFWLWSNVIDFQKRGDVVYWLPTFSTTAHLSHKLSDVAKLSDLRFNPNESENDIFSYIDISNINIFNGSYEKTEIKNAYAPSRARKKLKRFDVIVSTVRPNRNATSIILEDTNDLVCSTGFAVLQAIKINPYYLFVFTKTPYFIDQLVRQTSATMYPAVNENDILNVGLSIPPEKDQQKVELIIKEVFQLQKESEEEYKEASLILENSIKEFFITDNQKPFWKWNDDIEIIKTLEPNFWRKTISSKKHPVIKFGDIFNYQKGTEVGSALYQDNGIPFLRVSDLGDLEIQSGNSSKYINETLFNKLKNEFQPHKGELLFSKDATIGLMAKVDTEEKQIISSGILRLQIKQKDFDTDFLTAFLTNKFINQEFVKNSTGSVIKHLNPAKLSKIELPLVDKKIQTEISIKIKSFLLKRQLSKQKLQEAKDFVENLIVNNK